MPPYTLNFLNHRKLNMKLARNTLSLIAALLLSACATVTSNDGDTVTVQWRNNVVKESVDEAALLSCQSKGKRSAIEVSSVSSSPQTPSWLPVMQIVTYRCSMTPAAVPIAKAPSICSPSTPNQCR